MRMFQLMVMTVVTSIVCVTASAESIKPEAHEKLETAIPAGIKLLEAKEYKLFLKRFVIPKDFKKHTKGKSLDEIAQRFGQRKASGLLAVLKKINRTKPLLKNTATEAKFGIEKSAIGKETITFVKVGKYWYIQN